MSESRAEQKKNFFFFSLENNGMAFLRVLLWEVKRKSKTDL